MQSLRIIKVEYESATDTDPSMLKIKENTKGMKVKKYIPFEYHKKGIGSLKDEAATYLNSIGINIVSYSCDVNKFYLFSDSWGSDSNDFVLVDGQIT